MGESESAAPTIFALSSAPGRAGVAVVRISGPAASAAVYRIAPPRPDPRVVALRAILHPVTGEVLDRGLVVWFAAPRSETGEEMAEFHLHGSRAVVKAMLEALGAIPGCRLAEPGEFARRAFENGKIDLAEVEGLADLIDAETDAQRRQALGQAGGVLSRIYEGWRKTLIDATALVEAAIDFSDEGDVGSSAFDEARALVGALRGVVRTHLDDGHRGEIIRDGFRVALMGPPNVGKSSLLNALARRDAAIVSEEAGTTRDVIEVRLDLAGLPVIVSDTAGMREAPGRIEQEGIRRSVATAEAADLVLWLTDPDTRGIVLPRALTGVADRTLAVLNKADLIADAPDAGPADRLAISAKTGDGLAELTARLSEIAGLRVGTGEEPAITQVRHRRLIETCEQSLSDFLSDDPAQVELRAEDLRRAADALGRITGRVDVEDVLDQVFGRFCIGK